MTVIEQVLQQQIEALRASAAFDAAAAERAAESLARADMLQGELDAYRATLPAVEIPETEPAESTELQPALTADAEPAETTEPAPLYAQLLAETTTDHP